MNRKIETDEFQKIIDDRNYILSCYEEMLLRINENETLKLLQLHKISEKEISNMGK